MGPDIHEVVESFDRRAPGYARSQWHRRSAERLVALCPLQLGDRVLDAATGTGFAALAAARAVGSAGHVLGVDISPGMLQQAKASVAESGLANVELLQADASDLPQYPAGSFDAVTCATGLLYMPFRVALREWSRLLRQGGVVAFSNMRAGSPRAAAIFRECAASFGIVLQDPTAPLGFAAACQDALETAGFSVEAIVGEPIGFSPDDVRRAWESNFGSVAYARVRGLSEPEQGAMKAAFLAALEREPEGFLARAEMLYAVGRR